MRIFFKGLNELRGIAAMAVVFHHIELYKNREQILSLFDGPASFFIGRLGKNGVYLFFVLSGFLITYLLLSELKRTNDINVRKFYIRRVLRIWPLYYLIVIISFFIFPFIINHFNLSAGGYFATLTESIHNDFGWKIFLFIFFLPNLSLILFGSVPGASQSWSVGVEEQFYLLWPQLLKRISNVPVLLLGVILCKYILYFGLIILNRGLKNEVLKECIEFLTTFNIELMAVGGIGAYLLFNNYLKKFYHSLPKFSNVILIFVTLLSLWFRVNYFLLSVLFLLLILLNINDKHAFLRNKIVSFFGDISYGIYMYHPMVMFFSFTLVNRFVSVSDSVVYNSGVYILTFGFTIIISFLSFRYFESFFLKKKSKFEVVASGKNPDHE